MAEASRCLNCKILDVQESVSKCSIPRFIEQVKNGNFAEAAKIIAEASALPAVCGRVCPQERQCESQCVLGIKGEAISIGKLERFVADWSREHNVDSSETAPKNGKKVAVIGSGPAGIACAGDLAKLGYDVTVFEALHEAGGVLVYSIQNSDFKDTVVKSEVEILKLGVKIETNVIGRTVTIDELFDEEEFEAVFIGSGVVFQDLRNKGEDANGVFSANEFLTRNNLMKAFKENYDTHHGETKWLLIGCCNGCTRTALRLGAEVIQFTEVKKNFRQG